MRLEARLIDAALAPSTACQTGSTSCWRTMSAPAIPWWPLEGTRRRWCAMRAPTDRSLHRHRAPLGQRLRPDHRGWRGARESMRSTVSLACGTSGCCTSTTRPSAWQSRDQHTHSDRVQIGYLASPPCSPIQGCSGARILETPDGAWRGGFIRLRTAVLLCAGDADGARAPLQEAELPVTKIRRPRMRAARTNRRCDYWFA